jgi:long-chain acyl-CoA synthetase
LIQEFSEILPHVKFYVMYGQTEASARLSYLDPDLLGAKLGSVGKAIPGVELDVLDENGEKVSPGETGEIVARGKNVMVGYWDSPEETASVLKGDRLFTGDLARVDEGGFIYIVGRNKDMINSGGNRVSPLEVEQVVCQLAGISECAAVGISDELLGEAIKLLVVTDELAAVTEKDIEGFCKGNLASYKVPKQIEIVSSLPKTASGKTKRAELRAV